MIRIVGERNLREAEVEAEYLVVPSPRPGFAFEKAGTAIGSQGTLEADDGNSEPCAV
jgi:hypothetical protein